MSTSRRGSGFTLIELIVFIVIVSVGLAGVLVVFNTVTRSSADPVRGKQAFAAAESLLEEILNKNFCDPDTVTLPAPGASVPATCGAHATEAARALFDDVDDYAAYAQTDIRDITDDTTVVLYGYNISVNIDAPAGELVAGDGSGGQYRIVSVSVTDTLTNQTYSLTGYKFNND